MGQRQVRVNELIKREISDILHTRYQSESVYLTISSVEVAPDLRNAKIFYSVLGEGEQVSGARHFFGREASAIRRMLGRRVVLKYLPHLKFIRDESIERGCQLVEMIDSLGIEEYRETENFEDDLD